MLPLPKTENNINVRSEGSVFFKKPKKVMYKKPIIRRSNLKIYMVHGELNEWNWNNY